MMNLFRRNKKNKVSEISEVQDDSVETIEESKKTFKRNVVNKTGKVQQNFYFESDANKDLYHNNNNIKGTRSGLSEGNTSVTQNQITILKKCKLENTAIDLMKILKRTNKTKFKRTILTPLVDLGFFELVIPEKPTSPNQKYRLTDKFVKKIFKSSFVL